MTHLIVEYTRNIKPDADIPALLDRVNRILVGSFEPGGIVLARAYELQDYHMADGQADYAFVHATLRIGAGLADDVKRKAAEAVFNAFKQHFATLYALRYLALSMELVETAGGCVAQITA
ncbi:MAG TPA: 5-carboxymethyl-2-hydroxymuconate isomerase [Steroidobacteraceae bacterium]|nr:5-carboxymethyl-2-hydroxymuconate isomerase [Steroidobacteraceae bacterium]